MEKFNRSAWVKFITITVNNDIKYSEKKMSKKDLKIVLDNTDTLVSALEKVVSTKGALDSNLFLTINPSSSEDRTWVRTFFCLIGVKFYSRMFSSLDRCHAVRIANAFVKAECELPIYWR